MDGLLFGQWYLVVGWLRVAHLLGTRSADTTRHTKVLVYLSAITLSRSTSWICDGLLHGR